MAKYEADLRGDLMTIVNDVENKIKSSLSSSCEERSDYGIGGVRVIVRAYERYSMLGQNRVSLTLTYAAYENRVHVTAIATGGSQATFFKLNTLGEESFLDSITGVLNKYK